MTNKRAEYLREWRKRNPEHNREACRKYYQKNKERLKLKRCGVI